jgi:osmotically-inducible protein OsmY
MTPDLRINEREQKFGSGTSIEKSIAELAQEVVASRQGRMGVTGDTVLMSRHAVADTIDAIETDAPGNKSLSDVELAQSAMAVIRRNAHLPPGKVRLVVRNGWLLLEGEVEGQTQKRLAEEAVRGLNGIRGMSNNILIESEVMAQRVSQKIDETFVRSARLSANRISVTARDHQIILSGAVRSVEERAEAETAAWAVPGVAQVVNRIRANG